MTEVIEAGTVVDDDVTNTSSAKDAEHANVFAAINTAKSIILLEFVRYDCWQWQIPFILTIYYQCL